jgi:hypothetical protein
MHGPTQGGIVMGALPPKPPIPITPAWPPVPFDPALPEPVDAIFTPAHPPTTTTPNAQS